MATLSNLNQNKEDKKTDLSLGGGAASTPTAGGMAKGPASSGKFTNVQSYVGANQNAGQRLAGMIGNRLNTQVTQAENKAKNVSAYGNKVDEETARLNEGTAFQQRIKEDPITITSNTDERERFRKLFNQQDISQQQQQEFGTLANEASTNLQNVGQKVGNLATETGRFSLLRDALGRPSYTTGQQRLDQALFQIGGAPQLANIQKDTSGRVLSTQNQLGQDTSNLTGKIAANAALTGQVASDLRNTLTSEDAAFTAAQTAEAQQLIQDRTAKNAAINTFLSQGVEALNPEQRKFIEEQLKAGNLGFDSRTYNVDASKFKQLGDVANLSAQNVIDQQELDRYNALLNLAERTDAAYTQVGDRGRDAAIKGQELGEAIRAARTGLENRFNQEELRRQGYWNYSSTGGGGGTYGYDAYQNLGSLLRDIEAGRNATVNAQYHRGSTGPIQFAVDRGSGASLVGGVDATEAAQLAGENLWRAFQDRLEQEGYNKTLGNVSPSGNYGVR